MRIAIFSEVFLPKVDGIVNTVCRLLDHLSEHGHESIVLAPAPAPQRYGNTPVFTAPSARLPFYPEVRLASPFVTFDRVLDNFRPDLFHLVNPISLGLVGLGYAKKHHLPIVASYHTDLPGFARRWGFGAFNEGLWNYFRLVHNQADVNYCPSQATLDELAQHGFQRLKVWSRGVNSNLFHPGRQSIDWRMRLSAGEPEKPLLLFAGRLSAEKRIPWLAHVLKGIPGTRLAIVGDGPQRPELESIFSGLPVVFTDYLRGEDLAAAYASADVFVFPAANETFGNVVLEAMASGLPVITPRSGGPLDFVTQGKHGYLFDPESVDSLVSDVRCMIECPGLAQSMGREGRLYAEQRDWEGIFTKLLLEYQQLVEQNRISVPRVSRSRAGLPIHG